MNFKTFQRYKFSLDDHPLLREALIDLGKTLATEGKTDGELSVLPVNDPVLEELVVVRVWNTLENAQEWADKWLETLEEYKQTVYGFDLPPGSYSIEITSS